VHRRIGEFRGDASITTWLYRITHLVVRSQWRRARWKRWLGLEKASHVPTPHLSPVEEVERRQAVERLYGILDCMNDKYRKVLVLSRFEDLDANEIARMTDSKPATVRVWLHRAEQQFQKLAQKQGIDQGIDI
jgi:RNA polymerase sigma-70 factor (ECF subfamily)